MEQGLHRLGPPPSSKPTPEEIEWLDREIVLALQKIKPIVFTPPTPEEIARRNEVAERILAIRDQIGPIGVSTSDLIREIRGWPDDDADSDNE